jgi:hypothetical protein
VTSAYSEVMAKFIHGQKLEGLLNLITVKTRLIDTSFTTHRQLKSEISVYKLSLNIFADFSRITMVFLNAPYIIYFEAD